MSGQWLPAPPPVHRCPLPNASDHPGGPPAHLTRWRCDCGVLWQVTKPGTPEALAATHTSPGGSLRWQRVPGALTLQTPRTADPMPGSPEHPGMSLPVQVAAWVVIVVLSLALVVALAACPSPWI